MTKVDFPMQHGDKTKGYRKLLVQLWNAFFVIFVAVFFLSSKERSAMSRQPTDYSVVPGKITYSQYYESDRSKWNYDIQYTYEVNGKSYHSNQVNFSYVGKSDRNYAINYVEKYPVGKVVQVYVLPERPDYSVLEPNVVLPNIYRDIFVLGLIAASSFGLWLFLIYKADLELFDKKLEIRQATATFMLAIFTIGGYIGIQYYLNK